jgi:hypothetical protein
MSVANARLVANLISSETPRMLVAGPTAHQTQHDTDQTSTLFSRAAAANPVVFTNAEQCRGHRLNQRRHSAQHELRLHSTNEASLGPPRWTAALGAIVAVGCWLRSGPSLPSDGRGAAAKLGAGQDWLGRPG